MTAYILKDHELQSWLYIATRKLCSGARKRVASEIREHYDEARAELLDAGAAEDSARVQAVERLGDPKNANRKFRKNYLTEQYFNLFADLVEGRGLKYQTLGVAWLCTLVLLPMLSITIDKWHWNGYVAFFVCLVVYWVPFRLLTRRLIPYFAKRAMWDGIFWTYRAWIFCFLAWFAVYEILEFSTLRGLWLLAFTAILMFIHPRFGIFNRSRFNEFLEYYQSKENPPAAQ